MVEDLRSEVQEKLARLSHQGAGTGAKPLHEEFNIALAARDSELAKLRTAVESCKVSTSHIHMIQLSPILKL